MTARNMGRGYEVVEVEEDMKGHIGGGGWESVGWVGGGINRARQPRNPGSESVVGAMEEEDGTPVF